MPIIHDAAFRAWEACVPRGIRDDQMWRFHVYRVSLYVLDLAAADVRMMRAGHCDPQQLDQLFRAVASVNANIAEGFGRSSAADRARCFGIALGSLRESFTWYRALESAMRVDVACLRYEQLAELRRILIGAQKWLSGRPPRSHLM